MLYIIVYNTRGLVEQGGLVQFYRVYYTIIIYHNRPKIKSKMELRGKRDCLYDTISWGAKGIIYIFDNRLN